MGLASRIDPKCGLAMAQARFPTMQRSMRKNVTALTAAILTALALVACGDEPKDTRTSGGSEPAPSPTTTATETNPEQPSKPTEAGKVSKDLDQKPEIPKPTGSPPTKLEAQDIVKGKGTAAKEGDKVTVQYVGVAFSTGEEFDASWERDEPFEFTLGAGEVIPGWDEGVVGMKEGGRRQLTIPAELAYGAQGSPPAIGPNETLVFVIDLEKVS
jgi:peptidylprolyl isomerase